MLSRIHVYAASLGLLLAGPAIAVGQSSEAVMPDRASAAAGFRPMRSWAFPSLPISFQSSGRLMLRSNRPAPRL